jgi:SPP1 gp7 family putative phage head morphogenesis protein
MAVKQLDNYALDWIKLRSLTLAKSINKTTLEALRHELSLGFEAGESITQLSKRIEGYFTDNAKARAEMVSRTEVSEAANEGTLRRYEQENVSKSEWLASPSSCEECLVEDGKVYLTSEAHGLIPKHPHCTCTWIAYLE